MSQRIALPSGTAAELAVPSDERASRRGLVVSPDIGGLRPLFADLCQSLADEHGWTVCAVEPWPGRETMSLEERLDAVDSLHDDDVLADLVAAADATGVEPVAVLGFCMGGMYAMKAARLDRFDRVVSFYGMIRVPDRWQSEHHTEPIDAVRGDDATPVLAIVGTNDEWTPADEVDELEAAGAEVVRYAGAEHGFVHDPGRPAHRADYAADAWRRVVRWLDG